MMLAHWLAMGIPVALIAYAFLRERLAYEKMRERAEYAEEALEDILVAQAKRYIRKEDNVLHFKGAGYTSTGAPTRESFKIPLGEDGDRRLV